MAGQRPGYVQLKVNHLPEILREELVEKLTIVNPKWLENERMGRWNRKTPKILKFYRRTSSGGITLPRGYTRQLILSLKKNDLSWKLIDRRRSLSEIGFEFSGELRPFQKRAAAEMLGVALLDGARVAEVQLPEEDLARVTENLRSAMASR